MIRFPVTWESRAELLAVERDFGRLTARAFHPDFCPACSEVIFPVPLLAPVFHPHRLAAAFVDTATVFVMAFLLCYSYDMTL